MKYECPSCGNIIKTYAAFSTKRQRVAACADVPESCSCGRKAGFNLIEFEKCALQTKREE